MRFVNRSSVAAPESLVSVNGIGAQELLLVRHHKRTAADSTFDFKAYKSDDVRIALRDLFDGKCAYCESIYEDTQQVEVEHFRPKGAVDEAPQHPGYWWLAMRWENLLASCIDCNRRRKQVTVTATTTLAEAEAMFRRADAEPAGKKNAFPTRDQYWCDPEDEPHNEQPLLIDPTTVDPSDHIQWVFDGELPVAIARLNDDGSCSLEGQHSIELYALNRLGLAQSRRKTLLAVKVTIEAVKVAMQLYEGSQPADEVHRRQTLDRLTSILEKHALPDRPHSELARAYISRFREELERQLTSSSFAVVTI